MQQHLNMQRFKEGGTIFQLWLCWNISNSTHTNYEKHMHTLQKHSPRISSGDIWSTTQTLIWISLSSGNIVLHVKTRSDLFEPYLTYFTTQFAVGGRLKHATLNLSHYSGPSNKIQVILSVFLQLGADSVDMSGGYQCWFGMVLLEKLWSDLIFPLIKRMFLFLLCCMSVRVGKYVYDYTAKCLGLCCSYGVYFPFNKCFFLLSYFSLKEGDKLNKATICTGDHLSHPTTAKGHLCCSCAGV